MYSFDGTAFLFDILMPIYKKLFVTVVAHINYDFKYFEWAWTLYRYTALRIRVGFMPVK